MEWRQGAACTVTITDEVVADADELAAFGLHAAVALHVADAANAGCDYFVTTDLRLMGRVRAFRQTNVVNPMEFLLEVENDEN